CRAAPTLAEAAPGPRPPSSAPAPAPEPDAPHILDIGESHIRIDFEPEDFPSPTAPVLAWIERCARAVAGYYGSFPVPWLAITVRSSMGEGIHGGQAFPTSPPTISVSVGERASTADFENNWSMTHEMVHLAFPNVPSKHLWIEEGLATFVEPIARARAGWLKEDDVWAEWIENMPQGQPKPSDGGLDGTEDWGRTYWGGALFCLVASVELLEHSGGRHSLDDALRAIVAAGGSISQSWPLERALRAGDAVTEASVLLDTYTAMKDAPVPVDLDGLWRKLGVALEGRKVRYDDAAPLASARRAIIAGRR
ncbi:MAG TPA: hypothetical protein VMG12_36445, partial [Polyangiaceae bacterium]|nr:hypothetical protein [Polyangiaceae bacterium]